ncbi:MAG: HEAT repeat domain-containing protein, partial [bacterium]
TNPESQIKKIVERIRTGDRSQDHILQRFGVEAVPALIKYSDDEDYIVRCVVLEALRELCDERAIPVFLERLNDPEADVRNTAAIALYFCPRDMLRKYLSESMLDRLGEYAGRWDHESSKAIELIGDLEGTSQTEVLRNILKEAKRLQELSKTPATVIPQINADVMRELENQGVKEDRMWWVHAMKLPCLKSLVKLGDPEATTEILSALKDEDVRTRIFGMDAVKYSGRREFVEDLLPLLNDKRKASLASTSLGDSPYLKVRDYAVKAIVSLSDISVPFEVAKLTKFTDEQIEQLTELIGLSSDFDLKHPIIDDGSPDEQMEKIVEQIEEGRDVVTGGSLSDFADDDLEYLLEYVKHENPNVRRMTIHDLREKRNDQRVIPVLLESLEDPNTVVSSAAMDVLSDCSREVLREQSADVIFPRLAKIAEEWSGPSCKAMLLLGDLGGAPSVEILRNVLNEVKKVQTIMGQPEALIPNTEPRTLSALYARGIIDDRMSFVPKMKAACLKALYKLGDEEAEQIVSRSLEENDVKGRIFGIEAIEYLGRIDLLKKLLPLLDDRRDAAPGLEAHPGGTQFIAVRDMVVNVVAHLCKASFSFKVSKHSQYTDAQVEEVREYLKSI